MDAALILEGDLVRLEPLTVGHVPGLLAAVAGPRDTFVYSSAPAADEVAVSAWVQAALSDAAGGTQIPFATVRRSDGAVVGSTCFLRIEHWDWEPEGHPYQRRPGLPDVAEIGATWLSPSVQRSGINTEAKYLMLTHAFEVWQVYRVALRTDARNERSRRAIERIGAKQDGMIRADRPAPDGSVRDSAVYSILAAEWPAVKAHIESLIGVN